MILFISLLTTEILLFLGFLVYFHDRKNVTNRLFFAYSCVIAAWSLVNYFSVTVPADTSLFWIRAVIFLAVPHVFLFYLFVFNFPNKNFIIPKRTLHFHITFMYSLMLLAISPFVFQGVDTSHGSAIPQPGPLVGLFAAFLLALSLYTFYLIFKKYLISRGIEKKQWLSISFGLTTTYILIFGLVLLSVVFLDNTSFVQYSSVFILPLFFGAAFAILRYQFLNVKIISTEALSFVVIVVSIWQILLADTLEQQILQSLLTAFIVFFSVLLIRSVLREVKQREQLQVLSEDLSKANEQLQVLDKARAEFISIASHQLRTPPATLKWYLAALISGDYGKVSAKVRNALEKSQITNNSLIALIDDMLNVSRIERGKMEFLFEETDVQKIVEETIMELTPQAKMRKLSMVYKKPKTKLPLILADREKLQQVFNNLIDNAIKYTKTGSVKVEISQTETYIQVKVLDTGKGLSSDEQTSIFEKYGRGKDSQKHSSGLGLGLYVAKIIAEHHNGSIKAESPGINKGTTFIVNLPIKTDLKADIIDLTKEAH